MYKPYYIILCATELKTKVASIPDLDEFRHTFFRFDNGYDKVQFIKRQKPFKVKSYFKGKY